MSPFIFWIRGKSSRNFFTAAFFAYFVKNKLNMLRKFTVSNFKNFKEPFIFSLEDARNYNFNASAVKEGVVQNAIVYGYNGVGKSNLGLALFDIVGHLTDFHLERSRSQMHTYLNANSSELVASFCYEFSFETSSVVYRYEKTASQKIIKEELKINDVVVAKADSIAIRTFGYRKILERDILDDVEINLEGAESLDRKLKNSRLSLLKYIKTNANLVPNETNKALMNFFKFVDNMLFFRSLNVNEYIGRNAESENVELEIIYSSGGVKEFELFLNKNGVSCNLEVVDEEIVFSFSNENIPFYDIASTGTQALALFYAWSLRLRSEQPVSFLFIDEFDAFYHHELSRAIVELLKASKTQFVLTTHNASIMTNDLLRPDCYFLMWPNKIQSLAASTAKELREAHNIEKMYKAGAFYE